MPTLRLFSYKLTNDPGFAPNPFGRVMTLATCKPEIRQSKIPGDWIAGFTSGHLNGDPVSSVIIFISLLKKILKHIRILSR